MRSVNLPKSEIVSAKWSYERDAGSAACDVNIGNHRKTLVIFSTSIVFFDILPKSEGRGRYKCFKLRAGTRAKGCVKCEVTAAGRAEKEAARSD